MSSKSTVTVHCITGSDNGLAGIVIEVDGYFEKQMTDPLFSPNKLQKDVNYIKQSRFIKHVYNMVDSEGNVINQAKPAKDGKYYPKKVLVWLKEGTLTPDQCKKFIETKFWLLVKKAANMKEYEKPRFAPTVEHSTFSELFAYEDIIDMVERNYCTGKDKAFPDVPTFFKTHKEHVYSFFPVGAVPQGFINDVELAENHLDEADAPKVRNIPKVIQLDDDDDLFGFATKKRAPATVPVKSTKTKKRENKSNAKTPDTASKRQKVSNEVTPGIAAAILNADGLELTDDEDEDDHTLVTTDTSAKKNLKEDSNYDFEA